MRFKSKIHIIGINPYVLLPEEILHKLFIAAKKEKGPIPVEITIAKQKFPQTLVKFRGKWRLYLNMPMRKAAGKDVGDEITLGVKVDPTERTFEMHPKLKSALNKNKSAKAVFDKLPPSRQKEIVRYIGFLKSDDAIDKNVQRALGFLSGKTRFVGRDKP